MRPTMGRFGHGSWYNMIMKTIAKIWHQLFLEERPSISLSVFRWFVAFTVIAHVIPSFFHMGDNYYPTAFKSWNGSFFPIEFIELVSKSPIWIINAFVVLFCVSSFFFLIGFLSQISCILMTMACYYFYALNAFHVGTLSWDILLVTLFIMCFTPYHGDYFSLDAYLFGDARSYQRKRPYFVQRLLQIQIGMVFFHTALTKVWPEGNWLTANPLYYVLNYPPSGTTKMFLLRDWLRTQETLCLYLGYSIVVIELLLFFFLMWRKTRMSAIYAGIVFHIILILTLDVPATFFFLFPAQLCLFIHPQKILDWIERRRSENQSATNPRLVIFDGDCGFCQRMINKAHIADLFAVFKYAPFQSIQDYKEVHLDLTQEQCQKEVILVESRKAMFGGFEAVRRLMLSCPLFYPLVPIFYFPGMGVVGGIVYRWVARNRSQISCKITPKSKS